MGEYKMVPNRHFKTTGRNKYYSKVLKTYKLKLK